MMESTNTLKPLRFTLITSVDHRVSPPKQLFVYWYDRESANRVEDPSDPRWALAVLEHEERARMEAEREAARFARLTTAVPGSGSVSVSGKAANNDANAV